MTLIQTIGHPKTRQYLIFCSCLVLMGISLPFVYHHLHKAQVFFHHGQRALAVNEYSEAASYFQRAHQAGLNSTRLLRHMLQVNMSLGNWAQAEERTRELVRKQPEDLDLKLELARILFIRGKLSQALGQVHDLLDHDPNWPQALYLLGRIYAAKGDFEAAIQTYKKILGERG